LFYT
jgi:hypothetical protein